jgi:hypothetical protein
MRRLGFSRERVPGSGGDAGDARLKLVYEESVRGWSLQSSVLDELRNRTGVLLAAASVASAFLGSADLTRHETFSTLSVLALIAFGLVVLLCVYVLWPTKGWVFTHEAAGLVDAYIKDEKSLDYMYENVAKVADEYRTENEGKLNCQFSAFRWASLALGVSIALWLIDLN